MLHPTLEILVRRKSFEIFLFSSLSWKVNETYTAIYEIFLWFSQYKFTPTMHLISYFSPLNHHVWTHHITFNAPSAILLINFRPLKPIIDAFNLQTPTPVRPLRIPLNFVIEKKGNSSNALKDMKQTNRCCLLLSFEQRRYNKKLISYNLLFV